MGGSFAVVRHEPERPSTNQPNDIQPGSAPGNCSVGKRVALYKPHPKNIPFDIRRLQRRSSRARRSLISLEVRAAMQECAMIRAASRHAVSFESTGFKAAHRWRAHRQAASVEGFLSYAF
jgi:hypothetical protein